MSLKTQSGRSMVEMLGTLAIIGVLSIGGIAGYTYAMNKYRANETINDINMRGIDLVRQVAMGRQTLSLSEWPTTSKAGYTINNPTLIEGDAYFSISNVPQSVCEMVYEGIQNNQTTKVEVNGTSAEDASACNKEEDNTMGFFFITNAGEGGTTPEDLCKNKTCPEGYSCTHGICMSEEPPRFATAYKCCNNDSMCGVCYYCSKEWGEDGYSGNCTAHADGTKCGEGTCQQGVCIADKECSDHSECDPGFYCDISMTPNKCIQAEFHKVVLKDINETVYISNRSQGFVGDNFNIEPDLFCELNGFSLISEEHFLSASFLDAFKNTISSNAPFCVSGEKSCFKGGDCMNGWMGYTICVDK